VVSRETIFAALFQKLQAVQGLLTTSRTIEHWDSVSPERQPAAFQMEGRQEITSPALRRTQVALIAEWYLYAHAINTSGDVVALLNTLVDACFVPLEPGPAYDEQTLGGLVTSCRIHGTIETSEGRLGQQAVAIIPIQIIANT
jgi:hypothetical protein